MNNLNPEITRREISQKVRKLRIERGLTQSELARRLNLSQNRLSEIEHDKGSFSAEQFLVLLKFFNVPLSYFVPDKAPGEGTIQNALARLGASHLVESVHVLPSERLEAAEDVVREVLVAADSPRHITALAPVLIRNIDHLNLTRLWVRFKEFGLDQRFAWLLDNTLDAIHRFSNTKLPRKESARFRKAELILNSFVSRISDRNISGFTEVQEDILGTTILSRKSLVEARQASSSISRRWGIISQLQPEDFLEALNASHLAH